MKDSALRLVPDRPTECLGVNDTARRGGKRDEEGKKEREEDKKRQKGRDTGEKK